MACRIVPYTLIFVKNHSQILLGLKKRGLGKDKWNGFGGKIEKDESIMQGAIRELKEESNLSVNSLKHIGVLVYEVLNHSRVDLVHVFTASEFTGDLQESEEMLPQWYNLGEIPYGEMWPDAKLWHPYMLHEKYFIAHVVYKNEEEILRPVIKEYESLDQVLKHVEKIKIALRCVVDKKYLSAKFEPC